MADVITLTLTFGFIVGFVYFLVWWSYQARADRAAMVGLYLILGVPGFLLLVAGVAVSVRGDVNPWGLTLSLTAMGFLLPIWSRFRVAVAQLASFSPVDPLHMTGLGLFFALIGYLAAQNILLPAPDEVAETSVGALVVQELFFLGLALACVGFGLQRTFAQTRSRLGVVRFTWPGVLVAVGVVVLGFVMAGISAALTMAVDPDTSQMVEQNLQTITGGQPTWVMAPLIGLAAGIGEESLFRGALQPRYGIVLTSLLFTSLHGQYGLSFILVGLFLLSVMLGWVAKRYGTTHAMVAHGLYNMVSVLLSAL